MMSNLDFRMFTRRRIRHIRQTEVAECGLACIAMVSSYHGLDIDLNMLRRRYAPSLRGASLRSLINIADHLGLMARPLQVELENLDELALPAILHWDLNHYVVLERIDGNGALILDPASGSANRMAIKDVSKHFTGVALELQPQTTFERADRKQHIRLSNLWGRVIGLKRVVLQSVILTIVMQAFVLATPYYLQLAIDQVVPSVDGNLLSVLAIGFGALVVLNAVATLLRSFILLSSGAGIGYTLATNIGRKLFRLPIAWFERRHTGDILSRFQSIHPIQDSLTQGLIGAIVDGSLAILTFILMVWYSGALAIVAIIAFALSALGRIASFALEREAREASIVFSGREQSTLIETLRGITTLRLFGLETQRHLLWQKRLGDETNANFQVSRIGIWQKTADLIISGLENVLSIWLAFRLNLVGGFSIGMIVAYLAYKQEFLTRTASLVDQGIAFRLLGLHLERLSDIALEQEEHSFSQWNDNQREFQGALCLNSVRYRYSTMDPWVLDDVNIVIPSGAHIAITGPSGGGKSTLAKIILSLDEPTEGQILVDGLPIEQFGIRNYRSRIAAVLQDDHLFAGSIRENISFFDDRADESMIIDAAQHASIHDDVLAMPMGYETLVGDMGSALSGGQRARVLLARALYRRPRLLLLDEGTAHLDPQTEAIVSRAIAELGITRIVIAHREETVRNADIVLTLRSGRIEETRSNRVPSGTPLHDYSTTSVSIGIA